MGKLLWCMFWFAVLTVVIFVGLGKAQDRPLQPKTDWHYLPPYQPKQHFWQKHPTRTKVLTAIGVGSIGLVIALATRHNCPKMVNGYPYDGTPPCPNPATYDPGPKK